MTSISRGDVAHLARLSRLELSDAELDSFAQQLTDILDHVQAVSEVAADDVQVPAAVEAALCDDLNTPTALAELAG